MGLGWGLRRVVNSTQMFHWWRIEAECFTMQMGWRYHMCCLLTGAIIHNITQANLTVIVPAESPVGTAVMHL